MEGKNQLNESRNSESPFGVTLASPFSITQNYRFLPPSTPKATMHSDSTTKTRMERRKIAKRKQKTSRNHANPVFAVPMLTLILSLSPAALLKSPLPLPLPLRLLPDPPLRLPAPRLS